MSNTKAVHIEAVVPFNWASNLTSREAKAWAAWVLSPSTGLEYQYYQADHVPSDNGGIMTRYRLELTGTEAISDHTLSFMAESLRRQAYVEEVTMASRDLDNDSPWYTIRTMREQRNAEARAKRRVERMTRGKHWETVQIADGITEAKLVPDDASS